MQTPFSADQFFAVFAAYNTVMWPAQVFLLALGISVVTVVLRAPRYSRSVMAVVAALWVWMAAAYHWGFFAKINPMAIAFGFLFMAEAAAIIWFGVVKRQLALADDVTTGARLLGGGLIAYALVGYPLVGLLAGQRYPEMPTFGLPCPTTIFTLGVFLLCKPRFPWLVLVIPVLWGLIATTAAVSFGVVEDFALPVVVALVVLARAWPGRMHVERMA